MKLKTEKFSALCLMSTIAVAGLAAPTVASAGAKATVGVANMYLWRGQNLTQDGAQVHGGLSYSADSGLYGGMWTSTETGGTETDLYVGFGNKIGIFSFDISYWEYMYPEERGVDLDDSGSIDTDAEAMSTIGISDSDASEFILSVGAAGFTAAAYVNADSDNDDNNYFTLAYVYDKFGFTYGMWDLENPDQGDEYTHLTVMYSATPELKFGISKAFSDLDDDTGVEEDPLFYVAYDLAFDLK